MTKLLKEEREVVITKTDDENSWEIFSDSTSSVNSKLLKVVRSYGVEPEPLGGGWRATLPKRAISFRNLRKAVVTRPATQTSRIRANFRRKTTKNEVVETI